MIQIYVSDKKTGTLFGYKDETGPSYTVFRTVVKFNTVELGYIEAGCNELREIEQFFIFLWFDLP